MLFSVSRFNDFRHLPAIRRFPVRVCVVLISCILHRWSAATPAFSGRSYPAG